MFSLKKKKKKGLQDVSSFIKRVSHSKFGTQNYLFRLVQCVLEATSIFFVVLFLFHGLEPDEPRRGLHNGLHAAWSVVVHIVLRRGGRVKTESEYVVRQSPRVKDLAAIVPCHALLVGGYALAAVHSSPSSAVARDLLGQINDQDKKTSIRITWYLSRVETKPPQQASVLQIPDGATCYTSPRLT